MTDDRVDERRRRTPRGPGPETPRRSGNTTLGPAHAHGRDGRRCPDPLPRADAPEHLGRRGLDDGVHATGLPRDAPSARRLRGERPRLLRADLPGDAARRRSRRDARGLRAGRRACNTCALLGGAAPRLAFRPARGLRRALPQRPRRHAVAECASLRARPARDHRLLRLPGARVCTRDAQTLVAVYGDDCARDLPQRAVWTRGDRRAADRPARRRPRGPAPLVARRRGRRARRGAAGRAHGARRVRT